MSSQIYWNCVTAPCIFISIRCFLSICLNTSIELASFIYIGISFQVVAPWIFTLNFLTSSLANRTWKSFDCLVFLLWSALFLWKKSLNISGTSSLQYLYINIPTMYIFISWTDNIFLATSKGLLWDRFGEHVTILISFFLQYNHLIAIGWMGVPPDMIAINEIWIGKRVI